MNWTYTHTYAYIHTKGLLFFSLFINHMAEFVTSYRKHFTVHPPKQTFLKGFHNITIYILCMAEPHICLPFLLCLCAICSANGKRCKECQNLCISYEMNTKRRERENTDYHVILLHLFLLLFIFENAFYHHKCNEQWQHGIQSESSHFTIYQSESIKIFFYILP